VTDLTVRVRMARVEGAQLVHLVDDFRELVGANRDVEDPAIGRLIPDPYPEDEDSSRAFRDATRDDLLDRRALDADIVRTALAGMRGDPGDMPRNEAFAEHDLYIPLSDVDAWMRTLTALRLVIAERLGIQNDDDHDPDDPRYGVYDWLGYRLELTVEAADRLL